MIDLAAYHQQVTEDDVQTSDKKCKELLVRKGIAGLIEVPEAIYFRCLDLC